VFIINKQRPAALRRWRNHRMKEGPLELQSFQTANEWAQINALMQIKAWNG
jgi:hypothetical protein